jgi:MFS family permease
LLAIKAFFFRNQIFFSLLFPGFLLGTGRGFTIPVLPIIARDEFNASVASATLIIVAPMVGGVLTTLPTGYLMDRIGRRKMLIAAPLVSAAAAFAVLRAESYSEMLLYMTISGLAQQTWQMTRLAVIADTVQQNQRGRLITGMAGLQRSGTLLGPFIGGIVGQLFGLRVPFILFGIFSLAAMLPTILLIKESAPHLVARRAGIAVEEDVDISWSKLLTRPVFVLFGAQFAANMGRGGAQGNGGPHFIFAAFAYGLGPAQLGSILLATGIIGIPIMLVSGQIMDRFGRKRSIVPATSFLGIGLVLMLVTAALDLPLPFFIVAFTAINLAISMMAGSMQTLGADVAPPGARGKFFGVNRLIAETGSLGNPLSFAVLTGLLGATAVGYAGAFGVMAMGAFTASAMIAVLMKETLRK